MDSGDKLELSNTSKLPFQPQPMYTRTGVDARTGFIPLAVKRNKTRKIVRKEFRCAPTKHYVNELLGPNKSTSVTPVRMRLSKYF
jgi:RNase P protein component